LGHRLHKHDPRAQKLLQMAYELDLEGEHIRLMRMIDRALAAALGPSAEDIHINVDGAIAGICGDLGLDREFGNALFIISRVPGLIAHAHEERLRERPMRRIDPSAQVYDGPGERRLPEHRK
jgi:citrate synthase